ncbi:MAG: hybrid sensor histidine kinase/response regulator [Cyanophyceae cyanobacterium]
MSETYNILVVDDDEVDRMAVGRALKKAGVQMNLAEAVDSATAIATLKEELFDCVFLDYRLPDRSGLELIRQLQALGLKVPLIVLTGQGDEQIAVELMKAGASDYLSKSRVTPETLSYVFRNAIRVHRAETRAAVANQRLRESNELLRAKNQELDRQRRQIEQQNRKLLEVSQLKSQFLATMSHELRTPMNAIMGFSQMLLLERYGSLTGHQKDMVDRIFNNGQNLLTMLNEVLDFSKIEAGQLELDLTELNLAQLASITAEELRSLATEKQISLHVESKLKNHAVVNDRNYLKRILTNLISNAIKFTERGGVFLEIREQDDDRIVIAVRDTGIGIAPDQLKHIFEAFRQGDQSLTRKHSGTGLGLAITDSLVKMMRGKILVESRLGKGSLFQVEIPRILET